MKRIISLVVAAALFLAPCAAMAATATVYARRVPGAGKEQGHVLWEANWPSTFAQNDSVYVLVPFIDSYIPNNDGSGVATLNLAYWVEGVSAAADSASMVIGMSPNITGPWTSPFSAALQSLTLTGTTPWVQKYDVAITSAPPLTWLRFAIRNKGAASLANKKFKVLFPKINQ